LITFWILALAIGLAGSAIVMVPLLRSYFSHSAEKQTPGLTIGLGVAVALALPVAAILLYARWTTWDWAAVGDAGTLTAAEAERMHSVEDAISGLEQRLRDNPNDAQGWQLLGRSYMSLERFVDAAGAYRRAVELTGADASVDLRAQYAEALFLSDPAGMRGEAGNLFALLLAEAPDNPRVIWYSGFAAFEAGDEAQGRALWTRLLEMDPPEPMRLIIEQRLGTASADAAVAPPAAQPTVEPGTVLLSINIDPRLRDSLSGPVPLFIFARSQAGGPPLAVVRRSSSELPLTLNLSDDNAMMEGIKLSDQPELQLVARLALNGSPAAQTGDLFGEVNYSWDNGNRAEIFIDQVVQ
jgi:cytochrome c-type biogenesis protein CcmH